MQSNNENLSFPNDNAPLIRVEQRNGNQVVSARELFEFLQGSERFSRWIERMFEYGFENGKDYTPYQNVHPQNGQEITDYALTLPTAKEIAMLQRNDKGKQARQYFLDCEKALHQVIASKPMDTLDIMSMAIQQMREQREELKAISEKQESFEADRAVANAYLEERQNEPVQTLFVTVRKALDELVKSYAVSTGADVKVAYTLLYKEFSLRYGINVYRNAKKQNLSGMSWIEANGYITQVYEIAKALFNGKAILVKKEVKNAQ